jgi:hypothetical protein
VAISGGERFERVEVAIMNWAMVVVRVDPGGGGRGGPGVLWLLYGAGGVEELG